MGMSLDKEPLILQSKATFIKSSILPFLAIIFLMISYIVLEVLHNQESGTQLNLQVKLALLGAIIPYMVVVYRNMFRRLQAIKGEKISLNRRLSIIILSLIPLFLIGLFLYLATTSSKIIDNSDGKK